MTLILHERKSALLHAEREAAGGGQRASARTRLQVTCDDFFSGQAAALAGGTTMHIDFALPVDHDLMAGYKAWQVGGAQYRGHGGCQTQAHVLAVESESVLPQPRAAPATATAPRRGAGQGRARLQRLRPAHGRHQLERQGRRRHGRSDKEGCAARLHAAGRAAHWRPGVSHHAPPPTAAAPRPPRARPRRELVQVLHGVQGRAHGHGRPAHSGLRALQGAGRAAAGAGVRAGRALVRTP